MPTISTVPMTVRGPGSIANTSVARSGSCSISGRGVMVGAQVTMLAQPVGDDPRHVGDAAERRRDAVAIDDRPPQRAGVDARRIEQAGEADLRHRVNRDELVAQRDAAVLERGVDADAFELAEAEQMRDVSRTCAIDSGFAAAVSTIEVSIGSVVSRPSVNSCTAATGLPI